MVPSASDNQHEILQGILTLNNLDSFDADITYGNGRFYKDIPEPKLRFDIDPQADDVTQADSKNLPLADSTLGSIVYDPPFLTYVRQGREHNSIMSKRFGGYWRYDELADDYRATIAETARVLRTKGILVVKCQDIIHNHKLHPTHINVVRWAANVNMRLKDLSVLYKKHRMPMPDSPGMTKPRTQKHARIHHSYFLVFENGGPIEITGGTEA